MHGGIHLAGVEVEGLPGSPRTASRRAVQGRWVSSGARRFGRGPAGPLAGDEFAVADGCVIDSEFEDSVEDQSPAA